jgi:hypothetical protein
LLRRHRHALARQAIGTQGEVQAQQLASILYVLPWLSWRSETKERSPTNSARRRCVECGGLQRGGCRRARRRARDHRRTPMQRSLMQTSSSIVSSPRGVRDGKNEGKQECGRERAAAHVQGAHRRAPAETCAISGLASPSVYSIVAARAQAEAGIFACIASWRRRARSWNRRCFVQRFAFGVEHAQLARRRGE